MQNLEPEVLIRLDLSNPKLVVQENLTQPWTHQVFIFLKKYYSQNPKPEDLPFCKQEIPRFGANNSSKNQELANIHSNLSFQHFTQKLIVSLYGYWFTMFMWCNVCCKLSLLWFACVVWSKKMSKKYFYCMWWWYSYVLVGVNNQFKLDFYYFIFLRWNFYHLPTKKEEEAVVICIKVFFLEKNGSKLSYFEGMFFFQISKSGQYSQVWEIGRLAIILFSHHQYVAGFQKRK